MPNRISLYTSEPLRPGADMPVFYEVEAAGDHRVALYCGPDADAACVTFEYAPGQAPVVWFSGLPTDPDEDDAISPGPYVLKLQGTVQPGQPRADSTCESVTDLTPDPYFVVGSFTTGNAITGQPVCVPLTGPLKSFGRPPPAATTGCPSRPPTK
ncbi:hypothetical protein ACQEU8_07205 [Streptomyces sp. CA-250714]|uniref:hypothetical protein n=1 Tax=Streptomyces sp. CA-250714 TaxID=3240060 RepID=UPI003D8CAD8E